MICRFLLGLVSLSCFGAGQVQLQWGIVTLNPAYSQILPMAGGPRLLGTVQNSSSANPTLRSQAILSNVSSTPGFGLPATPHGNGNDVPHGAAVDPSGNIWIVGETDSDDFPLVNPIVAQKVPYRRAGFVMELDVTGSKVLFATYVGGQTKSPLYYQSRATAIAIDSGGNAYVGGQTDETDFPTTPGALVAGKPGADNFTNTYFYSFVVKISAAGKLLYGALAGTGKSACYGGSSCIPAQSTFATVTGMAVDGSGAATLAGLEGGADNINSGYVARLSADGSKLAWSMTLPVTYGDGDVLSLFMGQDANGNVDVFGGYQTLLPSISPGAPGLFAAQVKADGSALNWSIDLTTAADANAVGMTADRNGNLWLAGTSSSGKFPALAAGVPNLGSDFVLRIDPAGTSPQTLYRLPHRDIIAPPVLDAGGNLLLLGARAAVLTVPPGYAFDSPAIVSFANAASFLAGTGISQGTLATIFGFDLPASPQVLFSGVPATVLYASPTQINIQVPFENVVDTLTVSGASGSVTLQLPNGPSLGIFTTNGVYAAALNQDGSVNAFVNPALSGTVLTLYGTGAVWPSGMKDGAVATGAMPLGQETNQFELVDGVGTPQTILYAGAAPGIIDGVFQINVELTPDVLMPLTLRGASSTGPTLSSNAVQVYLRQP